MHTTHHIDLRHSLWTPDVGIWERSAPDALACLRALSEGDVIVIETAPKKEIRFGTVVVRRLPEGYAVTVEFRADWDEIDDVADTLGIDADDLHALTLEGVVPYGTHVTDGFLVATLDEVFDKVDAVEENLIDRDKQNWHILQSHFA